MSRIVYEPVPKICEPVVVQKQHTKEEVVEALKPVVKVVGKSVVKVGVSIAVLRITGKVVGEIAVACGVPEPVVPIVKAVANSTVLYLGGKING